MSRNRKVAIPLSRGRKDVILVVGIKRRRPRYGAGAAPIYSEQEVRLRM